MNAILSNSMIVSSCPLQSAEECCRQVLNQFSSHKYSTRYQRFASWLRTFSGCLDGEHLASAAQATSAIDPATNARAADTLA